MAELGATVLHWTDDAVDPGIRETLLPDPAPEVGDDFDWQQRDFESFRLAMWNELQERFPERRRWTPGDMEAVLVEVLAYLLDQLSDMADRVSAEAYLLSSRRVASLLSWLSFIGYRPWEERQLSIDQLVMLYRAEPHEMELDRRRGPTSIRRQRRMASASDYGERLEHHPLVERAYTKQQWNGSWLELVATVALWKDWCLDDRLGSTERQLSDRRQREITEFHKRLNLRIPQWQHNPTIRELLGDYVRRFRMSGQTVLLDDVIPVGVIVELCIALRENYFQSEIRREVNRVLGCGPEGFFRPGRLAAGQDIQLSDIYERVMNLDGVANVVPVRFGKLRDDPARGDVPQTIEMGPHELAVCTSKGRGKLSFELRGGRRG